MESVFAGAIGLIEGAGYTVPADIMGSNESCTEGYSKLKSSLEKKRFALVISKSLSWPARSCDMSLRNNAVLKLLHNSGLMPSNLYSTGNVLSVSVLMYAFTPAV